MPSPERRALIEAFLARAGWGGAGRAVLAGDASNRRYDRLTDRATGASAVLMDAPPDRGEDVRPFLRVARHLRSLGLSAPEILAEDAEQGFLLLEDLGDALFARVIAADPGLETPLYECAIDLLAELHRHPAPADLAAYDAATMGPLGALPFDWYLPAIAKAPEGEKQAFQAELETILARHCADRPVLAQRDYHAENLIWLPDRRGIARVGLLDFQDAMAGHPAYDLVSLLEDARRDVPPALQQAMIERYIAATSVDRDAFLTAYACLGAQRNLRILGVFARLCIRDGKPYYVDLMPRVWGHLQHDLAHPALAGLRARVERLIPAPDATIRERIKARCPITPTP